MKDLGEASYILGIKIYRDRSRRLIGLSQSTYLDKILKKFKMDGSKKGFLPMLQGKTLSKTQSPASVEEREIMDKDDYASAIGSIMYAMLCTRPDVAHAISLTSRSRISLSTYEELRICFLYTEVKKRSSLSVISTLDLTPIRMTLSLNPDTYFS